MYAIKRIKLSFIVILLVSGALMAQGQIGHEPPDAMKYVDEIIFAERKYVDDLHCYANIGFKAYAPDIKNYRDGGKFCKISLKTGKLTVLIDDPKGGIRDPQINYDATKILFSWRRNGSPYYHLYEIKPDGMGSA